MTERKNPYAVLGLTRDCSTKDVCRSYRILALKYHPDKQQKKGDREECRQRFQDIKEAYDILRDPSKRRKFDKTGSTESDPSYENIEAEDIEAFAATYPGSKEEQTDLKDFYNQHDGDISALYEWIPLSEPSEESLKRYLEIYDAMIEAGELDRTDKYKKSQKRLKKTLSKSINKFAKERKAFAESGLSFDDLVSAIQANKKRRLDEGANFFMAIEGDKKPTKRRKARS